MQYQPISFAEKFAKFSEKYAPKVIAQMNDYQFKLAPGTVMKKPTKPSSSSTARW